MGDGYRVNPQALKEAADGINGVIGELKTMGLVEEATEGRGFSGLKLTGLELGGGSGLAKALDGFCERWSWGVRALVQDGNAIAERLGLSAGAYWEQEQYLQGVLKDAVNTGMGNPHLTDDQVEKQSWSQTLGDNPLNDFEHPDYSAKSFEQAGQHMEQTWKAEGRDMMDGQFGINKDIAEWTGNGAQYEAAQNRMFGPPPSSDQQEG